MQLGYTPAHLSLQLGPARCNMLEAASPDVAGRQLRSFGDGPRRAQQQPAPHHQVHLQGNACPRTRAGGLCVGVRTHSAATRNLLLLYKPAPTQAGLRSPSCLLRMGRQGHGPPQKPPRHANAGVSPSSHRQHHGFQQGCTSKRTSLTQHTADTHPCSTVCGLGCAAQGMQGLPEHPPASSGASLTALQQPSTSCSLSTHRPAVAQASPHSSNPAPAAPCAPTGQKWRKPHRVGAARVVQECELRPQAAVALQARV